jgi:hypothetical protein
MVPKLEGKMDLKNVTADIIHTHGSLTRQEKLMCVKLFMANIKLNDFFTSGMIGTSTAQAGKYDYLVDWVHNIEFTSDAAILVQRRGRAS